MGGFDLGVARLTYPAESKQITLSVQSSGDGTSCLIQSRADDSETGKKSQDFVIVPPLSMLLARKKTSLRIMSLGETSLPTGRETLYWMDVKAVSPTGEKNTQKSTLQLAPQNEIRLFYRPEDLPTQPGEVRNMLRFKCKGKQLKVINPPPYYLTLTGIKVQGSKLPSMFVPPKGNITASPSATLAGKITYQTINGLGATTERQKGTVQ